MKKFAWIFLCFHKTALGQILTALCPIDATSTTDLTKSLNYYADFKFGI